MSQRIITDPFRVYFVLCSFGGARFISQFYNNCELLFYPSNVLRNRQTCFVMMISVDDVVPSTYQSNTVMEHDLLFFYTLHYCMTKELFFIIAKLFKSQGFLK
jgi:hypothetical protein